MSLDPLTGLPIDFVRMLAIEIDPYTDKPTKPLDLFFEALVRAQVSAAGRKDAETISAATTGLKGGRQP